VLVALFLAGIALREVVMRVAVWASEVHGVLGTLVLALAPIVTLSALVLMLRTVRTSLPWLRAATAGVDEDSEAERGPDSVTPSETRPRRPLDHLGSVLVPFLAVYASYGYLKEDTNEYFYRVWKDEALSNADLFTNPGSVDTASRLPESVGVMLVVVVAVAVALRRLLAWWEGARRRPWLGIFSAYLEVIWITLVAWTLNRFQGSAQDWILDRRIVRVIRDMWNTVVDSLGPLAQPVHALTSWLGGLLGSANAVIVVPVAWLTVGAVVYGHRIAPPPPPSHELYRRATERWAVVPAPVRRVGAELSADTRDRFGLLVHGVRLVAGAGLRPMLLFCLAFLIAQTASDWLWQLERLLIGPHDLNHVWRPLAEPLSLLNQTVATVLLVCLLGAAVERVLRTQGEPGHAAPAGQPAVRRA
jgi:hypothetical protein